METYTSLYWIERYKMEPHPEGGYYRETYRSAQQIVSPAVKEDRSACTSIHYLLENDDFSGFHRLWADEIWYFHLGAAVGLHLLSEDGTYQMIELSSGVNGMLSLAIPAGYWFAAELTGKRGFSLVSCAVAPGFDFRDFEMADKEKLNQQYPQHRDIIMRLCR
ncbi:cupin domain-containing protein [Pedobacter metabolipauper]|uniref:DUF985 domain-containing protein n=1 Tax=Pedobacter metabolipauper TaxID=425513 RepID=A0A4R6T1V6_9SPHI|nr:cupin domain-containing protein [Pedobacter metabolipauper]TDQ11490.1 hypothetical protein ATK78_0613 [Pedobacter metabolipauper]